MDNNSFLASEIIIGDLKNRISIDGNGSMVFSDANSPDLSLRDITSGSVVTDPAILKYISNEDPEWIALATNSYGQVFYKIAIEHNWQLTGESDINNLFPIGVLVEIFDTNNVKITVESIEYFINKIEITSSKKLTMKVAVKRIG